LIARGARRFKFTDRTFNVNEAHAVAILNFFLERLRPRMQIHFEIMPDRLSEPLLKRMAAFPDDVLHLEIGVQTVSPATQQRIGRCQNLDATWEAIHFLRTSTGARLHADLILGLPGDDGAVIAAGFDRLVVEDIPEIQIGLLKRLRGTAMAGDLGATSVFNPYPPYEVLQTSELSFDQLRDLKRLARYFDLYYNSGNFPAGLPLLWHDGLSPFDAFARFSRWLWQQEQRTHQLPLSRLFEQLYKYLVTHSAWDRSTIARILEADYRRLGGRRDKLSF
jgi:hypothetical protein